eukprot:1536961-Pleurochrysis_carterae.AAC.1
MNVFERVVIRRCPQSERHEPLFSIGEQYLQIARKEEKRDPDADLGPSPQRDTPRRVNHEWRVLADEMRAGDGRLARVGGALAPVLSLLRQAHGLELLGLLAPAPRVPEVQA